MPAKVSGNRRRSISQSTKKKLVHFFVAAIIQFKVKVVVFVDAAVRI